jgi:phage shock protein C
MKRLMRSKSNKWLGGVCAGVGDYLQVDPTVVRVLWIIVTVFTGFAPGILLYFLLWLVMPEK